MEQFQAFQNRKIKNKNKEKKTMIRVVAPPLFYLLKKAWKSDIKNAIVLINTSCTKKKCSTTINCETE